MNDLYKDDSKITSASALNDYSLVPSKLTSNIQTLKLTHAVSDDVALAVTASYLDHDLELTNSTNKSFMGSSGLSDIALTSLHDISNEGYFSGKTILEVGVSLPTGSITEFDNGARLPYKLQLGSGTFDPIMKLENSHSFGDYILSSQMHAIIRFGHNDEGYRLGNEYAAKFLIQRRISEKLGTSIGLSAERQDQIAGSDNYIENITNPMQIAELQNGDLASLDFGFDYLIDKTSGLDLSIGYNLPIYQNLNGPSLAMNQSFTVNLRYLLPK